MNSLLFLLRVLLSEFLKNYFLLKAFFIAILYFASALILINYPTFLNFLLNDYPLLAKVKILFFIFTGTFYALSFNDLLFISIISILFGLNLELILRKIKFLAKTGNLHLTFGVGILSLFAAGCASCGLSLASFAGLAGAIVLLPFRGVELYFISIIILTISLLYNLRTLVKVCKLK